MTQVEGTDLPHGTVRRARAGCEAGEDGEPCEPCTKALAAAEYAVEYRKTGPKGTRKSRAGRVLEGNRVHGRIATYIAGCGCDVCRAAATEARRRYAR